MWAGRRDKRGGRFRESMGVGSRKGRGVEPREGGRVEKDL